MVWIGRRVISVRGILAPCLVFGGVTGAAQALQVPRFAPQRRRTLQFPAVVDIGSLAEPDQADAASLALVASIVQRPGAGATVAPPNEWRAQTCIVDVALLSSSRPYGPDEISKTTPMKPDISLAEPSPQDDAEVAQNGAGNRRADNTEHDIHDQSHVTLHELLC